MKPALEIATRIVNNAHLLPWLDALLLSKFQPVESHRRISMEAETHPALLAFRRRTIHDPHAQEIQAANARDKILEDLLNKYKLGFGFMNHGEDPLWGREREPLKIGGMQTHAHGQTHPVHYENTKGVQVIYIFLQIADLEGLLVGHPNDGEIAGATWFMSNVIIHELMHAMWCVIWERIPFLVEADEGYRRDPYFEDEQIGELGFSMENVCFGGIASSFLPGINGYRKFGYFSESWPSAGRQEDSSYSLTPEIDFEITPLSVRFFEEVQQKEFWDIGVRRYGFDIFHGRHSRGRAVSKWREDGRRWRQSPSRNMVRVPQGTTVSIPETYGPSVAESLALTPDERAAEAWARRFVRSSIEEERFWDHQTALLPRAVEDILNVGHNPRVAFLEQASKLANALGVYHHSVQALLDVQRLHGSTYLERRQNLLAWNKGTRRYTRQLRKTLKSIGEEVLGPELEMLDLLRMCIGSPDKDSDKFLGADFDDLQIINRASNETATGNFAEFESVDIRLRFLDSGLKVLREMRAGKPNLPCPEDWEAYLESWIGYGEEQRKVLVAEEDHGGQARSTGGRVAIGEKRKANAMEDEERGRSPSRRRRTSNGS
ncbi:hypothetical protein BJ875DRAFT_485730 [Amylocarpus encephaloides]|uniref:Uncharacterized protein n=1 Tax=Amylocarpus encephaloides TaxID=45428 RepID=A0A9P7YFJ8_9HELO|nr:hypothetical protein BJ875DRAFT_485730 [Amylocarpus encephaloides]